MTTYLETLTPAAELTHTLQPYFRELASFDSTQALEASTLYALLRPEIERVLKTVVTENFAPPFVNCSQINSRSIQAAAWNIERGARLDGIISELKSHPVLAESDVLLLTEVDYGMARSRNAHVAREIAEALGFNYAFAPSYIALSKGNGTEVDVKGENTLALHGNALLSRFPIDNAHALPLPNGKDKLRGNEKRLGSQRAIVADINHPHGTFRAASLHLDAHSSQNHRHRQMKILLDHLDALQPRLPVLIGGDWNTSGYNSRRALYSIIGYWRRVMMGVGHVVKNHYPYPERWFERHLFRELERRGYDYRTLNQLGACTLHYDVTDINSNTNLGDWVPQWCFKFIRWALAKNGGQCGLKLDWFAGQNLAPDPTHPPRVVGNLRDANGKALSDHDAIVVNLIF